ncbi:MAG: glycosyltransferase family 2 protein, partial [Candidatus Sumerlaeia bacterium]|nr:glycosyltransferase family 2 protein [Candidatus Sumerlaeia bacterium]
MLLSVIMPVYNEQATIDEIIRRVRQVDIPKELIIVDDFSTDGTRDRLKKYENEPGVKVIYHQFNQGKGAALRTGIAYATGDLVIFQDADLEYHPEEYPRLIEPIIKGYADVVYGSRFKGVSRAFLFWHFLGNKLLTLITNILYNSTISDMETCYKVFKREVIQNIKIKSNRFNVEPEITAKILKRKLRVVEVPITYTGRDYT